MNDNPILRRTFIKNVSKAAGAAALVSPFTLLSSVSCAQTQKEKLGIALVGLGNYSSTMLGPSLLETENCYLAGIVTGTPDKADSWAKKFNLKKENVYNYDNYDEIANNSDIDIIYVVLPNSMHAEYTIRALEAGKHVICEKPMGLNAEECQRMIDTAKKVNRKLAIGYRLHYDPYFIEVKRLAQNEVFGKVNFMEGGLGYSYTPQAGHWRLSKAMGGGSLYNLGVYPIQGVRHAKGSEPIFVTAQAMIQRPEIFKEVYEMFTWQLEWADGTMASCFTGPNAGLDRLYVGCVNGWINNQPSYNYSGQAVETSNGKLNYKQVNQQKLQMDDFARCVMQNEESIVSGEEGLKDLKIVDAIYRSIASGKKEPIV